MGPAGRSCGPFARSPSGWPEARSISAIEEADLAAALDTAGAPDPDLLIRTSGEYRLSNFLLWQMAYTELLVLPKLWPDFAARDLFLAIADFQRRSRRFGGL